MVFNSKILLFGEYVILKGAMSLAIPFSNYAGKLVLPNEKSVLNHSKLDSNAEIKKLAVEIIKDNDLKYRRGICQFLEDALCGLYFDSNIPQNYGLGSSGALVASIYNNYFNSVKNVDVSKVNALREIKKELAKIESYFHGFSSGIDPLISYLNRALILKAPIRYSKFTPLSDFRIVLIDSGISSSTKSFINIFNQKFSENQNKFKSLIELNNQCIISLMQNKEQAINTIFTFCNLEQELMPEMFVYPIGLQAILEQYNNEIQVKLCGSGGGGNLIGFIKEGQYDKISYELTTQGIVYKTISLPESKLLAL